MICVIGAGIVGCASAYQLAREGHRVLLLDAASGPGEGCSFANGGQLSYSYVEPLATPATLRALPKMLLERDSPVTFRPTLDWRQYAWGLQFLAACRAAQVQVATRQLLELSFLSRDTLADWMLDGVWPISFERNGKLVLCPDDATLQRQVQQMRFQATLGCEQQALSVAQCLEKEPALLGAVRRAPNAYVGGIWTPGECVADAHAMCGVLVDRLRSRGGQTRFGTRVTGFAFGRRGVQALLTSEGELACDAVVLAAGSASARLAQQLDEYLPVYPIKGYSLTLPIGDTARAPRVSVTDLGRKTVFAPLAGELRVAAMAEISGHDLEVASGRIEQMRSAVTALYTDSIDVRASGRPWSGLRPATPSSLPIVRRSRRHANVYLNVGHGALGLTLAAGSAVMLHHCVRRSGPA
jgi:D-amino-acid dehydrogenase